MIYNVRVCRDIPAPADEVYRLLAAYRTGHPRILPSAVYSDLQILEGGFGPGTRVRFVVRASG